MNDRYNSVKRQQSLAITPHTRSANRYFSQSLSEQAFGNLMAMTDDDFDGFKAYFNNRTGQLGRKL